MGTQHATGYTCHMCGGVAVVDIGGGYVCAEHAIETMIEVDLRADEPTLTVATHGRDEHRASAETERDRR